MARTATVEIVVPVYNEERALERSVRTLRRYLDERFPEPPDAETHRVKTAALRRRSLDAERVCLQRATR